MTPAPQTPPAAPADAAAREGYLVTEKLVKRFDEAVAVDEVSLSIAKGEIFALLGSSGCGKSTLLRMLAGFETPTSGRIRLGGQDVAGMPPYERPVNMMFQSYALFPHLSLWENVAFGLKREGLPRAEVKKRTDEMLALVQLSAYAQRRPHQLSGGQQQRVAIARALVNRPRLMLFDEVTSALDPALVLEVLTLLRELKDDGMTLVIATHEMGFARRVADRVGLLAQGRLAECVPPDAFFDAPQSPAAQAFVRAMKGAGRV